MSMIMHPDSSIFASLFISLYVLYRLAYAKKYIKLEHNIHVNKLLLCSERKHPSGSGFIDTRIAGPKWVYKLHHSGHSLVYPHALTFGRIYAKFAFCHDIVHEWFHDVPDLTGTDINEVTMSIYRMFMEGGSKLVSCMMADSSCKITNGHARILFFCRTQQTRQISFLGIHWSIFLIWYEIPMRENYLITRKNPICQSP